MSVTISGTNNDQADWVSVTEAAMLMKVSERTVQRWIENQRVVSDMSDDGRRRVRRGSLPMSDRDADKSSLVTDLPGAAVRQVTDTSDTTSDRLTDTMSDVVDCPTTNDTRHALSDIAAGLERERDQALDDVAFLRQQLQAREDARREEMERIDQERAEMRRLLLTSQQLAHELAQQLEQKALPAHNDVQEGPVKKARWWFFGRR